MASLRMGSFLSRHHAGFGITRWHQAPFFRWFSTTPPIQKNLNASVPPRMLPANMLERGSRIGGFEIVAPLRAGGMASFYLARRIGPGGFVRPVGIKVVHAHLAKDRAFVEMFLDEARLSARILHPNVVHVEELGESEGMFFLAMELVHGAPLSSLLGRLAENGRVLRPEVACAIAMKVLDGLHAAHEVTDDEGVRLEVVHRDVSPQNVLVAADGRVKLIDFGIAKARGRLQETEAGSLKGKVRYMSPEQAWGRPIDRRTDVYALGIVLWESLMGRRLFGGANDIEALEQVRAPVIGSVHEADESISAPIDDVLRTALALLPEERFDTAQAFRRALGNACPAALTVEADEIGALVRATLPVELARERALLSAFSGVTPEPRASDPGIAEQTVRALRPEPAREESVTRDIREMDARPRALSEGAPRDGGSPSQISSPSAAPRATPVSTDALRPTSGRPKALALVGGLAVVSVAMIGALAVTANIGGAPPAPAAITAPAAATPIATGPCDAVVHIEAGDGTRVVTEFDTRGRPSHFAMGGMRNPAGPPTGSVVFSYVVPGDGPLSVEMDTAIAPTDPLFDSVIGVFRGACIEAMATAEPAERFDDNDSQTERRAVGAVRATGGETLTIVVSGYGGAIPGRLDESRGAIAITTVRTMPPVLRAARVEVDGEVLSVHVEGTDADGDVHAVRLRFHGEEGAPLATVQLEPQTTPGDFASSGSLDVGEQGAAAMGGSDAVEVALLDREGNSSAPLVVQVTTARRHGH